MRPATVLVMSILACGVRSLPAQRGMEPLSRAAAIARALERGPALPLAGADTAVAAARLLDARQLPDPTLAASYTRDIPRYHLTLEMPFDMLWLRGPRIAAAEATRRAAGYRFDFTRALVALDVDTAYTRALAAREQSRLSTRNLRDADSLLRIAIARRDAGDASDLDVHLARIGAGQASNIAVSDSLAAFEALSTLQAMLGMRADVPALELTDSLAAPSWPGNLGAAAGAATLPVASATADLAAASLEARVQHRSIFAGAGLLFGFDAGDPGNPGQGLLPTVGVAVPLPLFNRNRGAIAAAEAERRRAEAALTFTQRENELAVSQATRGLQAALGRVLNDRRLTAGADSVAALSLIAYREGAAPLTTVLEAQRTAREVLGGYIEDVASALIAAATLHALTLTPSPGSH